jgi:hypothetical protein
MLRFIIVRWVWPMKYPGAPMSGSRMRIKDLKFIEERSVKHRDG